MAVQKNVIKSIPAGAVLRKSPGVVFGAGAL